MTDDLNREAVARRLDRLREDYGQFPVVEDEESLPPDVYADLRAEATETGYTGSGYAWVVRDPDEVPALTDSMPDDARESRSQVLLVLNRGTDRPAWNVAGGGREGEETYEEATRRELREETGIDAEIGRPFLALRGRYRVDRSEMERGSTPEIETPDAEERLHLLFVAFDATYRRGTIDVQEGELRGAAWFAEPPAEFSRWAQFRAVDWFEGYDPPVEDRWWGEDVESATFEE